MTHLVFDTGPIITLTLNGLLWTLEELKKRYSGRFYITPAVKEELVDYPLKTKKFKFEAFQVLSVIRSGVLEVYDSAYVRKQTHKLLGLSNKSYTINGQPLQMLHYAEVSVLAAAEELKADAIVVDERMTRLFLENPDGINDLLRKRYRQTPRYHPTCYDAFRREFSKIPVVRSTELMTRAFELGILDRYIPRGKIPFARQQVLDGLLWGLKLNGCAVSEIELKQLLKSQRSKTTR